MDVNFNPNDGMISIRNNGNGINTGTNKGGIHWPQVVFCNFMSGGNYFKKNKKTGGKNGYGAKLTNFFSKIFIIETIFYD